ncbi:hypothetical protein HN911_13300, partial [Candidatus Bathyarchaeota archaeon]|nr:hypothetical protein [Candidatus Bathyarchaeota archaeon]
MKESDEVQIDEMQSMRSCMSSSDSVQAKHHNLDGDDFLFPEQYRIVHNYEAEAKAPDMRIVPFGAQAHAQQATGVEKEPHGERAQAKAPDMRIVPFGA